MPAFELQHDYATIPLALPHESELIIDLWPHNNQDITLIFESACPEVLIENLQILSANVASIKFVLKNCALKIKNLFVKNANITHYGATAVEHLVAEGAQLHLTLSTQVTQSITARNTPDPDDVAIQKLLKGMTVIPGCGEDCYGPKALESLRIMKEGFPTLEWISPVVAWFGSDAYDASRCHIFPGVESKTGAPWTVGQYNRSSAHCIEKDSGNVRYGGTPPDDSVISYLSAAKEIGLKIMLNPMLLMDVKDKPWRGHLTGDVASVETFYSGYEKFILHYATIAKGMIDAFLIGSELKKMTAIKDGANNFPFVTKLKILAATARCILGPGVKISYAADWSEYHHAEGGWRALDALWLDPNVDFVGIDAYPPITTSFKSRISVEDIKKGLTSGIDYEYYLDFEGGEHRMDPWWGNKAFKVRWEGEHWNPNGTKTTWSATTRKPIWFTEFGFPSIDKATNQPNVFYNPESRDGGAPRYSNGQPDDRAQKLGIRCMLEEWTNSAMIPLMFLYCYDSRGDDWETQFKDGPLKQYGHWVDGKIGTIPTLTIDGDSKASEIKVYSNGRVALNTPTSSRIQRIAIDSDYSTT